MPKRKDICDCKVLENASKEPGHPIRWDERMNEYHIVYGEGGRMMIYYCPFCGGSVPKSKRSSLFAHVDHAEQVRIYGLFEKLRTVADVVARFGSPDEEHEFGSASIEPERAGKPESGKVFRSMVYKSLSPVADIIFQIGVGDSVAGMWRQKYNGDKISERMRIS